MSLSVLGAPRNDRGVAAMTIGILQSALFGDLLGTAAMREVFGEPALIRNCVAVEAALARAQARLGIVPEDAAADISRAAEAIVSGAAPLDLERLRRETATVGFPILPLVRQLAERAGDAGRYLHWGATTQDIMDSAAVLQIRDGLGLVEADLTTLRGHLAALARKHRDTPMPGRTFFQQALPVTFGYKAAVWLSSFDRHASRLDEIKKRVLMVQFGGAVGTLASLGSGDQALRTTAELARELGLAEPAITWHVARDTIAETVQFLALLGGSMAKIADEVMLMSSTEFGEASEPFETGRGASSTMPQKRNPISCGVVVAAARALRQQAGLALDAMVNTFERNAAAWHLEWIAVPEAFGYAAGALCQSVFLAGGLVVDSGGMAKNLGLTHGLIVAEAVMMGLAPRIGRNEAHHLVTAACHTAIASGRPLYDVLIENKEVAGPLGAEKLKALTDPANYLGAAQAMVDRVLNGR
jgi:3-carboxy-cis,cis-muconate cycloisomerase